MSIVITPEFWQGATARALSEGLRLRGEIVTEVDFDYFLLHGDGVMLKALAWLAFRESVAAYNRALLTEVRRSDCQILLAVKGYAIKASTIDESAKAGVTSVIYYPDVAFEHPMLDFAVIERADLVCTTKRFHLPFLDKVRGPGRSIVIQHGYSPAAQRPLAEQMDEDHYEYDICYVGNPDAFKLTWLARLAAAFPNKRVIVAGNLWREAARGTALERFCAAEPVVGDRLAWLHQHSRINIAIHGGPGGPFGWSDDVSTRTFEIPACGAFMLHIDNEEVRALYDVPVEIDTFGTPEQLCLKVAHYLERPVERARMIERAFKKTVPAYSYHARAAEILTAARAISRPESGA